MLCDGPCDAGEDFCRRCERCARVELRSLAAAEPPAPFAPPRLARRGLAWLALVLAAAPARKRHAG